MSRILQVAHYYPPHVGGLERVTHEVAHGLQARGHRVDVLTSAIGAPAGTIDEDGVLVTRLRALNPFERFGVPFPIFWPSLLVIGWRAVGRADVAQIHDMLYLSSWWIALVCRLRRTPYVVTGHVGLVDHPSRLVRGVQRIVHRTIGRRVLAGADHVLPISASIEQQLLEVAPEARTTVLPNGVDTSFFRPAAPGEKALIRARHGLPVDEALVLFVGRPVPKKGYGIVAAAGSPAYRIVFAGVDAPPERHGHLYLGSRPVEEVAELYRAADAFVCASVGEAPLTVLEAMSSGLPVVVNDDPALQALGLGDGATYVTMTPDNLRRHLEKLLADDLAAAGEAAAAEARGMHSRATQVEQLDGFLSGLLPREQPLRVALLSPRYPPWIGGVEKYVEQLARAGQDASDAEVVVITTCPGWRSREESVDGVRVIRLPAPFRLGATPLNPGWFVTVPRLLRRLQVDVVNVHSPGPGFAELACFRSAGRPVVMTYHSGSMVKGAPAPRWVDLLLRTWERFVLPRALDRAAGLIACSPVSMAHATGRAVVIPPSVDLSDFAPGPLERDGSITYVGRIESSSRWKGLHVLVDALPLVAERVPGVRLDLIGEGDDVAVLQSRAERLGVAGRIRWHGSLSHDKVAEHLRRTSVAVLPSLTDAESFGTVIVEAMACATPVVGSDVGGIPGNISDGENGYLVPPGDHVALADALARVLENPELARRMGAASREIAVERFDLDARNAATYAYLRSVAEGYRA
ncbi:glycosyltransferase family 4 protein [Nocardioides sp. KC13]|uniref:Glycosyltransferase family 4 protein n=1 Tax=Nocardioides turkmenicus TaxID=2711220 RepID=A0A6M1R2U0_9ACTN|nr:glycosyltransferase family 4 protein [Nocardioides sp. KC13]NGN92018.1 glycosyltransferase family 4 protein [Nocardioides sp. KC13]